jgi:DNA segregation ATPase FtsK/SpoIIIE, S-DNA-T family
VGDPPAQGVGGAVIYLLPALAGSVSVVFLFSGYTGQSRWLGGVAVAAVALSVLSGVLVWWLQWRGAGRRKRRARARYLEYLERVEQELSGIAAAQQGQLAHAHPDTSVLTELVAMRRRVWERRRHDPDHLSATLGRGRVPLSCAVSIALDDNPLVDYDRELAAAARAVVDRWSNIDFAPIAISLATTGRFAVNGPADQARALARHLVCQLAAMEGPDELQIMVAGAPDAASTWEWARWLPHVRRSRSRPDGLNLLAFSPDGIRSNFDRSVAPRLAADGPRPAGLALSHLLLVVDGETAADLLARAAPALLDEPSAGVSVIWLLPPLVAPPFRIDARATVTEAGVLAFEEGGPGFGRRRVDGVLASRCSTDSADRIARSLAPLELVQHEASRDLGDDVRLVDLLEGGGVGLLRVPIGERRDGQPLVLDLKEAADGGMGPHGLVVGATGSGKSELLRTLVTALAAGHDPDTLNFVFVDYKGGASFADLARLPHCAGMITNLEQDPTLIDRMLAALFGEQERRQRLLREAGNLDDIRQYRARRREHPRLEPMPYLLLVVDEFGELLAARPDFLDLFVTVGRLGRSLGVHLLLATQRLEEGRVRGLEGHLRYRVCLRTFSAEESTAVLGTRDAFNLPPIPGVGYLRVDQELRAFKAAAVSVRPPASPPPEGERLAETDMEAIISRLAGRTPGGHQVWLPPLPDRVRLGDVLREPVPGPLRVPVGLLDLPRAQRQEALGLDFSGIGGHLAVVGAPQSGKSTLLRSLIGALASTHDPRDVQLYCVDLGGGALRPFESLPHVGAVAGKAERERILQVIHHVAGVIDEREVVFREHRLDGMAGFRAERRAGRLPDAAYGDVFLLVDDLGQVNSELDQVEPELIRIATIGLNYGVHLVVTANRWPDIRPKLRDAIGSRLELRLNDPLDSEVGRRAAASLAVGVPGRGLTREGLQFQVAVPDSVEDLLASARAWGGEPAPPVLSLPPLVTEQELVTAGGAGLRLGLAAGRLPPVLVDLTREGPHLLVFGDGGSGKTNLLRACVRQLSAEAADGKLAISIVDYRRRLADLVDAPNVWRCCRSPQQVQELAGQLLGALSDREPAEALDPLRPWRATSPANPGSPRNRGDGVRISWGGRGEDGDRRHFLVVDDYDWVASATGNPLAALTDLLLMGQDIGFHVVLARRVGGATRSAFEPFLQRLREMGSPGVILSGDPHEGPVLGGHRAQVLPPGRGLLVRPGQKAVQVQTVHAPAGVVRLVGPAKGEARLAPTDGISAAAVLRW